MKNSVTSFFILLALLLVVPVFSQKGYKIKVKINNLKDTTLILGHYFSDSKIVDDTITLDNKGSGIFKGKEPLPQGVYFIYLPTKSLFDIIVGEDQDFSIENDTIPTQLVENLKIEGSQENVLFKEYQLFLKQNRQKIISLNDSYKDTEDEKKKEKIREEIKEIHEKVKQKQKDFAEENPNTFFAAFVKATLEVEVPDPPRDENGNIIDSTWQYYYYRNHYFDNFPLNDDRLLRTPFYNDKVLNYVDRVIPQVPDSIKPEIDYLISQSRESNELFRNMLVNLFNHYAKNQVMGMDAVFFYIAEKYYIPEASWSDSTFITKLKKELTEKGHLLIGNTAPDFEFVLVDAEHFIQAAEDTALAKNPHVGSFLKLHQVNADYTILAFWESDCGHCKKTIPELYELYQKLKSNNVAVISIHMIGGVEGKEKWIDFINKYQLHDWINGWNPYSYEYKKKYAINSTPVIFVLDKDKKIIAKRIAVEQAEEIINHYLKKKN
ncbi:MAG: thioredoxin-like domain-containing protein [bacterium]